MPKTTTAALTTYESSEEGKSIRFTFPTSWYAGGEDDQNGHWIGGSAGTAPLYTYLSDRPFEPLCFRGNPDSAECKAPAQSGVLVRWVYSTGMVSGLFAVRMLAHRAMIDGHLGWAYEGPGKDCAAGTREIAVGVPDDPGQPDRSGIAMIACLTGPELAVEAQQVHAMVASLTLPPPAPNQAVADLCWRGTYRDVFTSGATTVSWVRARAKAFAPDAPNAQAAAWCWTQGEPGIWELWAVTAGAKSVRLTTSDSRIVPTTPDPVVKDFVTPTIRFSYPDTWYAGGYTDQHGEDIASAGPVQLLTYLSDRPFEPVCLAEASGTTCGQPLATTRLVWVRWYTSADILEQYPERAIAKKHVFYNRPGVLYEGPPKRGCSGLDASYEIALVIPATPHQSLGVGMTACLEGPHVVPQIRAVRAMVWSLRLSD